VKIIEIGIIIDSKKVEKRRKKRRKEFERFLDS
jgi:hypothetical protein